MTCCAISRHATLCHAMPCYAMLCRTVSSYAKLCYVMLEVGGGAFWFGTGLYRCNVLVPVGGVHHLP